MTYTPGPWKARKLGNREFIDVIATANLTRPIVSWIGFDDSDRDKDEHFANAILIAAAPDLLEACMAAVETIDGLSGQQAMPDDSYLVGLKKIQAAIAKAAAINEVTP